MFETFQPNLDPGDIYLPRDIWVANPIDLTSNHAQENITITVYFYTQVVLRAGYYAELNVIGSFQTYVTLLEDQSVDENNVISFPGIVFDKKGTYGPVRLIIYSSENGQIVASCVSYGGIAITDPKPDPGYAYITYTSGATQEVLQSTSLDFFMSLLNPIDIYDYIALKISEEFTVIMSSEDKSLLSFMLVVGEGETAYWKDIQYYYDKENRELFLYNLNSTVPAGTVLNFRLTGIANPITIGGGNYNWEIQVFRYGTKTITHRYHSTDPQSYTVYAVMNVSSWVPSNPNIPPGDVYADLSLFMTISFYANITIPSGWWFQFNVSSIDLKKTVYKIENPDQMDYSYVENEKTDTYAYGESYEYLDLCSVSDESHIKCYIIKEIPSGEIFEVSILAYIVNIGSASIVEAKIFNDNKDILIKMTNSIYYYATTKLSSAVKHLKYEPLIFISKSKSSEDKWHFYTGVLDTGYIIISFQVENFPDSDSESEIIVSLPISDSTDENIDENFQSIIIEKEYKANCIISSDSLNIDFSSTNNVAEIPVKSISNRKITFNFSGITGNNNAFINIILYSDSEKLTLPYFESSLYTKYDLYLEYKSGSKYYQYGKPFTFQAYKIPLDFSVMCTSSGIPGMPAFLSMIPIFGFNNPLKWTSYIEFTITGTDILADLGSGLDSGEVYPSSDLDIGDEVILLYGDEFIGTWLQLKKNIIENNEISFYFPLGTLISGKTYNAFGQLAAVNEFGQKFIMSRGIEKSITADVELADTDIENENYGNYMIYDIKNITITPTPTTKPNSNFISALYLEKGFSQGPNGDFTLGSVSSSHVFNSSNPEFKSFSTFWIMEYSEGISYSFEITNLIMPWFADSHKISIYFTYSESFSGNTKCEKLFNQTIEINPNTFTPNIKPKTSSGFGSVAQYFNFELLLTPEINIPIFEKTSVEISINEDIGKDGCLLLLTIGNNIYTQTVKSSINIFSNLKVDIISSMNITAWQLSLPTVNDNDNETPIPIIKSVYLLYDDKPSVEWTCNDNDDICTTIFSKSDSAKASDFIWATPFPNQRGAEGAYFQLKASFPVNIPSGTNITIYGQNFTDDPYALVNTWCSHLLTSVAINNNQLSILIYYDIKVGETFELRKDYAINVDDNDVSNDLYIFAKYKDTVLIDDTLFDKRWNYLIYDNATVEIRDPNVKVSKNNKGELEKYTFSFRLGNSSLPTWAVLFDIPGAYDMHFGQATDIFNNNKYYLECESTLANIECCVDHWIVTVTGFKIIPAGIAIDISIRGFTPPVKDSGNFGIYIKDTSTSAIVAVSATALSLEFTDIPQNLIDFISVSVSDHKSYTGDYKFDMYLSGIYSENSAVKFLFPMTYSLRIDNPDTVECSANFTYTNKTIISSSCTSEDNWVTFVFENEYDFGTSTLITVFLYNIVNPYIGDRRSSDFDVTNVAYYDYDFWVQKFQVYGILKDINEAKSYTGKSYMNLNAGYTGFYEKNLLKLIINNKTLDNPENAIKLTSGLSSAQYIIKTENDKVIAKKIVLTPYEHKGIIKFDKAFYTLTPDTLTAKFRVKVEHKASVGMYYVGWNIYETPLETGNYRYAVPIKNSVYLSTDSAQNIIVSDPGILAPGTTSLPIKISLGDYSTFSSFQFRLENLEKALVFKPDDIIEFKAGEYYKYFTISVPDQEGEYQINFQLTGDDKDAFVPPSNLNITVGAVNDVDLKIINININPEGVSEATINIELSTQAEIAWVLGPSRLLKAYPDLITYKNASAYFYPLIGTPTSLQKTIANQINRFNTALNSYSSLGSYVNYTSDILNHARSSIFYHYTVADQQYSETLEAFVYEIEYTLVVWAFNTKSTTTATFVYSHTSLPPPIILSLSFTSPLNTTEISLLINSLSDLTGILKNRFNHYTNNNFRRRLSTTTDIIIYSSPRSFYTAQKIYEMIDMYNLQIVLSDNNIEKSIISMSYSELSKNNDIPSVISKEIEVPKDVQVIVSIEIDKNGIICCVVEKEPQKNLSLTAEDIYLGYGRDGKQAQMHKCAKMAMNITNIQTWDFTEDFDFARYTLTCTACNTYPVTPQCESTDSGTFSFALKWDAPDINRGLIFVVSLAILLVN
ncbi:hypothetical protein SteCoe_24538 [Stentor coeruleus]|uniref:Uncharacterized protein n=1 Tax=Stentor coeruleus TaxID=5963 RepID=A0A1R2BHC8_9CILI|nr:hypothetical protein SteCoe_24538 [Stentor coeruleus]